MAKGVGIISTNNITHSNGKPNWFAIGFLVLISIGIIYQIVENHLNIQNRNLDKEQGDKIASLQSQIDELKKKIG